MFKSAISDIIDIQRGEIRIENKRIFIGTSDRAIELIELQQSGKKQMKVKDYLKKGQI